MARFTSVVDMVKTLMPEEPVHCVRPHAVEAAAKWFVNAFPGNVMYSVKSNPDPEVLKQLKKAGVKYFDVASLHEVQLARGLFPDAELLFMHPVKSRQAIRKSYYDYGVRTYSLDTLEELKKIIEVIGEGQPLNLFVRLAIPNSYSAHDLSGKFGADAKEAVKILKAARKHVQKLGICFHVGSQCMHPNAYSAAMMMAKDVMTASKVKIDALDVGGGFPSIYPGLTPPPLADYMKAIAEYSNLLPFSDDCEIWCEPGRALVAESGSLVVRVELRKGNNLYINDGIYGALFDAGFPGLIYPVRMIRPEGKVAGKLSPFSLYGPTCDSLDAMKGPFYLPSGIKEGDYIEIGQLGAYGATLRTHFNGFYSDTIVEVADAPLMSLYGLSEKPLKQPVAEKQVEKTAAPKQQDHLTFA